MDKIQLHACFAMVVIIVAMLSVFGIALYRDKELGLKGAIFGLFLVLWVGFLGWAYVAVVKDIAKYFMEK